MQLIIGNRNYSSWSLRAWLHLTESQLEFELVRISLDSPGFSDQIARYSPARRVPVLIDGEITVWDTMAIFEYVLEKFPSAISWPEQTAARAHSRSVSAEMHAGFMAVRDELPQNLRLHKPLQLENLSSSCQSQVERIEDIWRDCYQRYGGPFLFGPLSIADFMYAPVALRFSTYAIPLSAEARSFQSAITGLASVQQFIADAREEPESLPYVDALIPAADNPLTLG